MYSGYIGDKFKVSRDQTEPQLYLLAPDETTALYTGVEQVVGPYRLFYHSSLNVIRQQYTIYSYLCLPLCHLCACFARVCILLYRYCLFDHCLIILGLARLRVQVDLANPKRRNKHDSAECCVEDPHTTQCARILLRLLATTGRDMPIAC
jgi:hypothetical protein